MESDPIDLSEVEAVPWEIVKLCARHLGRTIWIRDINYEEKILFNRCNFIHIGG